MTVEVAGAASATAKRRRVIALAALAIVTLLVVLLATRPSAESTIAGSPLIGLPAPAFEGQTLDGKQFDPASVKGRYVVLNFFATWCVPCQNEHPAIKRFSETHTGPNDPAVVAVAYDKNDLGNARSFFAEKGGNWPVLTDGSKIAVNYGVRGLPETFVIAPDGRVAKRITGEVTVSMLDQLTRA